MPTANPWTLARRSADGNYRVMARCRTWYEAATLVDAFKQYGGAFSIWFEVCSVTWYQEEVNRLQEQKSQLYAGKVGVDEIGAIASLERQQQKVLLAAAYWCNARRLKLGVLTFKGRLCLVPFEKLIDGGNSNEVAA